MSKYDSPNPDEIKAILDGILKESTTPDPEREFKKIQEVAQKIDERLVVYKGGEQGTKDGVSYQPIVVALQGYSGEKTDIAVFLTLTRQPAFSQQSRGCRLSWSEEEIRQKIISAIMNFR